MYRFLLVEDNKRDIENCESVVKMINRKLDKQDATSDELKIAIDIANNHEDTLSKLKENEYDGCIIDIVLCNGDSGDEIIKEIMNKYRLPVVIMTGTPYNAKEQSLIPIYIKGEKTYEDIIEDLKKTISTGIFNVIGGKGVIEEVMLKIFWDNLCPQIDFWKNQEETEKALLRYTIAHIQELIDDEVPTYITEEMYIKPPINKNVRTGSIVKFKPKDGDQDNYYGIVLSPPCDLANNKTDNILVCKIENYNEVHYYKDRDRNKKNKKEIEKCISNNNTLNHHWLPKNSLFKGGYINFRDVYTYSNESFKTEFGEPIIKVQEFFVKNILNRFSSYYARQGQPDFDFEKEAKRICDEMNES